MKTSTRLPVKAKSQVPMLEKMELWGRYKWPGKWVFLKLFHPEINGVITYNHTGGGFRRWREAFCRFFSRLQHGLLHRSDAKLPSLVHSWRKAPIQNGYHLWKKEEKANKQANKLQFQRWVFGWLFCKFRSWQLFDLLSELWPKKFTASKLQFKWC